MQEGELKDKVIKLFTQNRRENDGHQYTVPSPESYPHQWLWDSCFHAIILSHFDVVSAKKELQSLISKQFESGFIPHIIYRDDSDVLRFDWGVPDTSAITQPPLLAYSTWKVFLKDNNEAFLRDMHPHLDRYYRYLLTRDPRGHHLVGLINPDESGEDNSPRFDVPLDLPAEHSAPQNNEKRFALFEQNKECNFDAPVCMKNFFWVKDVPYNSYMVENLECMNDIAITIGKIDDAKFYKHQVNLIREAMRTYLFDDGLYWSIYGHDHIKMKVKTWAIFAPLIASAYSEEEARVLIKEHLLNTETFHTPYPVPTTAKDERAYLPEEPQEGPSELHPNWRGPVWMAPNWFVYRGLRRYGFHEEARHIREKSIELIQRSGFREYFHPETGEGLGARDFTWGGLIFDMSEV